MTDWILFAWVWFSVAVFVTGCAWRAFRYIKAPIHLRWDLYPVAHEPRERREHGGSYLEEREWWTRPRHRSLVGELTTMAEEALFLRGVWLNNRRVFWGSLPFHWGLYLLIFTSSGLALLAAGWHNPVLRVVLFWTGATGGALLAGGALTLSAIRWADPGLRRYTAPGDRLNLGIFTALGILSAWVALSSGGVDAAATAAGRIARFDAPATSVLLAAQMAVAGLVLVYLPFTRMVHFFAKYFLYHDVRWDDRPMEAGSVMEQRVQAALQYPVSWSAEHVGAPGSWAQVATAAPPVGKAKP